jgi:hypothetical protein
MHFQPLTIIGLAGISNLSHDAGYIDDSTGPCLGRNLEEGLRAVEDAGQVGVDDGLPSIRLHPHGEAVTGNPGIVDEDIDGAKFLDGLVEKTLDGLWIGGCSCAKKIVVGEIGVIVNET